MAVRQKTTAGVGMWEVRELGDTTGRYVAMKVLPTGGVETHNISAHCLACAKTVAHLLFGGPVDRRGYHLQGKHGELMVWAIDNI